MRIVQKAEQLWSITNIEKSENENIMINRHVSSVERTPNGGSNGSAQFMYSRSISTPSPSLPKAIPFNHRTAVYVNRSHSAFVQSLSVDGCLPPCSAPVTFNRYINVSSGYNASITPAEQGSSPTTSWYARLSSSLKKSVLRRSTSHRESPSQAQKRNRGAQRRSVMMRLFFPSSIVLYFVWWVLLSSHGI